MTVADFLREKGWERYVVVDEAGNTFTKLSATVGRIVAEFSHMTVLELRDSTRTRIEVQRRLP